MRWIECKIITEFHTTARLVRNLRAIANIEEFDNRTTDSSFEI